MPNKAASLLWYFQQKIHFKSLCCLYPAYKHKWSHLLLSGDSTMVPSDNTSRVILWCFPSFLFVHLTELKCISCYLTYILFCILCCHFHHENSMCGCWCEHFWVLGAWMIVTEDYLLYTDVQNKQQFLGLYSFPYMENNHIYFWYRLAM